MRPRYTMWLQPFTQSEVAGLLFGTGILAAAAAAPQVDRYIARQQRRYDGRRHKCSFWAKA